MKAKCRKRVESELGRPLDEAEVTLIDQSIVRQLRQASSENRAAFKAMSPAQRIRQAGARAAEDLRGYRYKGDAWSNQDKEDLRVRIEREAVKAGGKINAAIEDTLPGGSIAAYQDRVLSFALNAVQGKTINGVMKALQATLSHELLHWARSMGFYSPEQWAELVTAAGKRKMTRGDAERAGKGAAWTELRQELGKAPTYQQYADRVYADKKQWIRQEEAVAAAIEVARSRYEQESADPNASIWRKALGTLIKMGRAVVRAIGSLTKNQQSRLQEYINQKERELRSGKTAKQARAFAREGLESSQRVKVQKIKEAITKSFQTEEINDLIRRIEDPATTAAEIAAAPIWASLEDLQDGPTVTPQQVADLNWWQERQYPHPDGSDQLLTPQEMVEYVKSVFESAVASKVKQQKRATLVSGAPGAGKSTLIKQIAKRQAAAVIATDDVRPFIPEYNDGLNSDDVANEARALTMQAYRELTLSGTNVVREVIGEDIENLQKAIAYLKGLGYSVDIVHVRADFTTRMRRMAARFLATGRPIAISDMIRIGNRPSYVHRSAARMQIGDGFYEVESDQRTGYRIVSRSGRPRPGTTKGVQAAAGGRVARVGRLLGGERPTARLKERALDYARLFQQWNETAGYGLDAMALTAGAKAKGANLTALAQARKMAQEGVDANAIRLKTGWFRPKDGKGKWRFLVSDGQIRIKEQFATDFLEGTQRYRNGEWFPKTKKLSDYIDSPVFEQYPWLKKVRVVVDRKYDGAAANPYMRLLIMGNPGRGDTDATPARMFAHEIQHLVSMYEHFEKGGNAYRILSMLERGRGWDNPPPKWAVAQAIGYGYGPVRENAMMYRAIALYLALTDEVQARAAEQEVDMTAEQLRPENYQPPVTKLDTIRQEEIYNALDHIRAIPLKLLAAIPVGGTGIYTLAKILTDYFGAQSFTPKDAFNLPQIVAAANEQEDQSPLVHQEFGLTREQSQQFEKMKAYPPVKQAMEQIGLGGPKITKITRSQYSQLRRALDSISDEDFITDDMGAAKRILARRLMQQFFRDEKGFKAFLEHGVIDGGFVGTDRPSTVSQGAPRRVIDTAKGQVIANPSTADLYRMAKGNNGSIRYIKNDDGNVFIGNANEMIHREIENAAREAGYNVFSQSDYNIYTNLKYKFGDKITGYSPSQLVESYNEFRTSNEASDEDAFLSWLPDTKRGGDVVFGEIKKDGSRFVAGNGYSSIDHVVSNFRPMESRRYTPPGGRFGAASSTTNYPIIGEQPGFTDDVSYVAQQIAAVKRKPGIGGALIQDKKMTKLKPWNIAGGKLDELDKIVEGSIRAGWANLFRNIPILNQLGDKAARYFQFGGIPDRAALEILRTMFQGRVGKAEELATELARDVSKGLNIRYEDAWKALRGDFTGLSKLSAQVREDAKDKMAKLKQAMTEEDPVKQRAMIAALPAELQAAGNRAMAAIKEVGDALVEHKIISARQRDKWSGHYLLRAYMEHFDSYKPTMGARASGAPYRAWRNSIPKDKRLTKGEIESLPFLLYMSIERPLHDIAAYSYLNSLMHHSMSSPSNPRWFLPDSLVNFGGKWRSLFYVANQMKQSETSLNQKKAELSDLGGTAANSDLARNLRSEIRLLERVINDMKLIINTNPAYAAMLAKGQLPDGYSQLPADTSVYGDAAGGIVMTPIYNDIVSAGLVSVDENTAAGKAMEAYSAFNRNVKFLLTVANPPTHLRNIYSNMLMLARSGTNIFRVVEAIRDMAAYNGGKGKASPAVAAAIKFGAMKQTFTDAELRVLDEFARGIENEMKKAEFRKSMEGIFGQSKGLDNSIRAMDLTNAMIGAAKNAYGDGMSWLYQNEDVIFKVAKIADELERNTPPALAALEARKYFFDYSAVPPVVRALSNSALAPFIRYTYFAVPNFLEQVATSPWRLMYTSYGWYIGLTILAAMMWGFQPDDAKKTMSEALADRPLMMPLPWRDEHDRIQWIDLGYLLPEGSFVGAAAAATDADLNGVVQALGANGGPLGSIAIAQRTGIDPFRGMPIYEETDDEDTKRAKLAWFTLRATMPSMLNYYTPALPGERIGGPGAEALWGTGQDRYGEPTQTGGQLMSRVLGVNVYPNDVPYGRMKRIRQINYQLRQIEQELDRTYRARDLTPEARERRINYLRQNFERILQERNEYIDATAEAAAAESRRQSE